MIKKLKQPVIDFFLYSYFGIIKEDGEDSIILKCAQRAYMDLCRTLKFTERADKKKGKEKKQIEEDRLQFRDNICDKIEEQVNELLAAEATNFDKKHDDACKAIIGIVTETDQVTEFNYGQAQKWLNMTMKYMWLLGLRQNDFARLLHVLHAPVDSYIMEAASKCPVAIQRKDGQYGKYQEGVSKPWSQWNYEEYIEFQNALRKKLSEAPIIWEGPAWIKVAERRKVKETESSKKK